jgi:small-conductance mechanosensitive channel
LKGCIKLFYFIFFLCFATVASTEDNSNNDFDFNKARTQIETIKLHLKQHTIKYTDLDQVADTVSTLADQAKACIKKNAKERSQLEALSSSNNAPLFSKSDDQTDDYLEQEKIKANKNLSDCNLLLYEAEKLNKKIEHEKSTNRTAYTFLKTPALWETKDISSLFTLPQYDLKKLYHLTGLETFESKQMISDVLIKIFFYLVLVYLAYRICSHYLKTNALTKQFIKPLRLYLPFIFVFSMALMSFNTLLKNIYPPPLICDITAHLNSFFIFLLFAALNQIFFSYRKKPEKKHLITKITYGAVILICSLLSNKIIQLISPTIIHATSNLSAYTLIYLTFISILFLWTMHVGLQLAQKYKYLTPIQSQLTQGASILLFMSLVLVACLGYSDFSLFFTEHLMKFCLIIFVFLELAYFIWTYARILSNKEDPLSIRFHRWAGIKPQKTLVEMSILKYLLIIMLTHYFFQVSVILWELPGYYLGSSLDFLENGLYLFNMQINLLAIFRGFTVFCFIIISGRLLGAFLTRKNTNFDQKNTRTTIITLTNYVAFIVGVLISLMVIGINLSGFALVASALSVGIGFGLKGIAADLISGLILLLSKPLRPGDYIEVKGVEGFISKIRLLSTEIKTLSQTNIILPNSSLLSQSVTNYTYKNKLTRSTTYIMIKDAADVKRTKKIMLDVAKRHTEVHQDKKNKPQVIVDLRPDRSAMHIVLTLWCIIKNADDRYRINSDINAKVLAAVEKAEIPLKL